MKIITRISFAVLAAVAFGVPDISARQYEAYIDSAENYIKRDRYAEAAECYRNALRDSPGSPLNSKIFANLGICLTETGDLDGALQAFDVALVREPSSAAILNSRAKTHLLRNDKDAAMKDLNMALTSDSLHAESLKLRAQIEMLDKEYTHALADFTTLRKVSPEDPWVAAGMAECYSATGDATKSIDLYLEAIGIEDRPEFNVALATVLINAGQLQQAADILREAIRRHPRTGELYLMRGVLHLRKYRNDDALTDKKTAISLGVEPEMAERLIPGKIR